MKYEKFEFSPRGEPLIKNNCDERRSFVRGSMEKMNKAIEEKPQPLTMETNLEKTMGQQSETIEILWICKKCGEKNYKNFCEKCGAAKVPEKKAT